jgi:hypothetical protein
MKPIEFSVNDAPHDITVSPDGEAVFWFYTSNMCDGELEDAIETLGHIWHLNTEVNLTIHARTRSLFEQLIDLYGHTGGTRVDPEAVPKLKALKRDCEWIIEQINNLEGKANEDK